MSRAYSLQYAGWMRNYKAMSSAKLLQCYKELEGHYGDAYYRVEDKGGILYEHLQEAKQEIVSRGLDGTAAESVAAGSGKGLTESQKCPNCDRKKRFYVDDYICKDCRDAMEAS